MQAVHSSAGHSAEKITITLSKMSTNFLVLRGMSDEIRIREDERGFLLMH